MSNFETRAFCPCGWNARAPFGDKFHIHKEVCPDCGEEKKRWMVKTVKFVPTANFWKYSTWGTGYFVDKEGNKV